MRTTAIVSVLSFAVATYAQDACLGVAAALPSCAVSLYPEEISDGTALTFTLRYLASHPLARVSAVN